VGDVVFGNLKIQALRVPPFGTTVASDTPPTTLTGIFALQVIAKSGPGDTPQPGTSDTYSWSFGPVTALDWALLFTPTYPVRVAGDTMLAIFQDVDPTGNYTDSSSAQTGSNGTFLYEFGFDTGGTLSDGFWIVEAPTDVPLSLPLGSADFDIGLFQLAGTDVFDLHDFMDYSTSLGTPLAFDVEGFGNFGNPPGPDPFLPIASDGDFFVLPVPEPASVAVWSVIFAISLVGSHRRRVA
jgi:hypothetical protein